MAAQYRDDLRHPITDPDAIERRLDAVMELFEPDLPDGYDRVPHEREAKAMADD